MRIRLTSGRICAVNASFGNRLIEQGRAVYVPEERPKAKKPAKAAGKTGDRNGAEGQD